MARKSKAEKQLDDAVDAAFKLYGNCVQFNMMDLSEMMREVKAAVTFTDATVDTAMIAAVAKYRQN